jgi:hypothetical protein
VRTIATEAETDSSRIAISVVEAEISAERSSDLVTIEHHRGRSPTPQGLGQQQRERRLARAGKPREPDWISLTRTVACGRCGLTGAATRFDWCWQTERIRSSEIASRLM